MHIKKLMNNALREQLLIPAFNAAYIPMVKPIVEGLKTSKAFGLIEVSRPDIEKFGAESMKAVADEFKKHCDSSFTSLHLDHVPVIDEDEQSVDWEKLIKDGIALGYQSVMIDGSRLSLEENIRITRRVVEIAAPEGVAVEAELGAVLGHEKGPMPDYEELFESGRGFTDISEAQQFVNETGVDWLSVAIGNVHGALSDAAKDRPKPKARLSIERLADLQKACKIPLVLHGGSGIEQSFVLDAIKNGISKINIGTEIRQAYERAGREKPGDTAFSYEQTKKCVIDMVEEYYHIPNSQEKLHQEVSHA